MGFRIGGENRMFFRQEANQFERCERTGSRDQDIHLKYVITKQRLGDAPGNRANQEPGGLSPKWQMTRVKAGVFQTARSSPEHLEPSDAGAEIQEFRFRERVFESQGADLPIEPRTRTARRVVSEYRRRNLAEKPVMPICGIDRPFLLQYPYFKESFLGDVRNESFGIMRVAGTVFLQIEPVVQLDHAPRFDGVAGIERPVDILPFAYQPLVFANVFQFDISGEKLPIEREDLPADDPKEADSFDQGEEFSRVVRRIYRSEGVGMPRKFFY